MRSNRKDKKDTETSEKTERMKKKEEEETSYRSSSSTELAKKRWAGHESLRAVLSSQCNHASQVPIHNAADNHRTQRKKNEKNVEQRKISRHDTCRENDTPTDNPIAKHTHTGWRRNRQIHAEDGERGRGEGWYGWTVTISLTLINQSSGAPITTTQIRKTSQQVEHQSRTKERRKEALLKVEAVASTPLTSSKVQFTSFSHSTTLSSTNLRSTLSHNTTRVREERTEEGGYRK
jgi:hypothetical protein